MKLVLLPFFFEMPPVRLHLYLRLVHAFRQETRTLAGDGVDTFSPQEVDFMMVEFID